LFVGTSAEVNDLTNVLADDFDNDQASSLVEFLSAMSNSQIVQRGKSIEVTGLSGRRVKFLLRKFLYVNPSLAPSSRVPPLVSNETN
jgi:hypothetical protein